MLTTTMIDHVYSECPIPSTHDKYMEARYFFDKMLKHYHDPLDFQFNLNAFIQAIRNITFMLQAESNRPEEFDTWYSRKQEDMRENPLLHSFVVARNKVVKRSSLATRSKACIGLFRGRQMKIAMKTDLQPYMETRDALEKGKAFALG